MSKVNISIDDVLIVTQMLGTVINKKLLEPAEFRRVQGPWERLTDAIQQLQRKQSLDKLYPPQSVPTPVSQPVVPEVPATSSAVGAEGDSVTVESENGSGTDSVDALKPVPIPTSDENVETGAEETSDLSV